MMEFAVKRYFRGLVRQWDPALTTQGTEKDTIWYMDTRHVYAFDCGRTYNTVFSCVVLLVPTRIEQSDSRMHALTWQPQIFVGGHFKHNQSTQCERSYDYTYMVSLVCARIAC